jgi:predicted nucleic acid-binding protein
VHHDQRASADAATPATIDRREVIDALDEALRLRLAADDDHAAPHLVDAEVLSVIRTQHRAAPSTRRPRPQAIDDLRAWPGERWSHRPLLDRAWDLRDSIRIYDALYVALAEVFDATLLTLDERLARAAGIRCHVEVSRS